MDATIALVTAAPPDLDALHARLPECRLADRARLRSMLAQAARTPGPARAAALLRAAELVNGSAAARAARVQGVPKLTYPPELPVAQKREEIAAALRDHQVIVVCGETGSGKTTQLPKVCLEIGRGIDGVIGHTQPRRVAARAVAARISDELGVGLGSAVGYKVRFHDQSSRDTYVKLMTDGILLAETQQDRDLRRYDTIIIDEAHERSLNIDFLLGYLRQLLPRRPDLKIIVTSATIDPERFARHFTVHRGPHAGRPVPIIEVSGRTYPVEVRYRPLIAHEEDMEDLTIDDAIVRAVDELAAEGPGDILVFLPGEREIREMSEVLRKHHPPQTHILPLYARLSAEDQMRVFQPHTARRIVLATNVAETSLTVPGIRGVVDTGIARISRYSARTKVQRLPIEPISRASADQRAGRCGRIGPGTCIRLFAESDYLARPRFTEPEILRTNLASVILQMKALKLGAVEAFPFVEAPDSRMVKDGYETLAELNAVDDAGNLTETGQRLAKLPIDPRIGRMILAAEREHCLHEVLIIAAALSVQDPRERPLDREQAADEAHAKFLSPDSDFLTLLNLWNFYTEQKDKLSNSKLRLSCRQNFLHYLRLREWEEVHRQLRALVHDMGLRENDSRPAPEAVHRALLAGLLTSVGRKGEQGEYDGVRGLKFNIFPGSGLFKRKPPWVVAAELVKTTKLYARTAAKIEPEWIERVGAHLVRRTHAEPRWDRELGRVVAWEKVVLLGLEVVPRRQVHFGPVDQRLSRELFIHGALVDGEFDTRAPFFAHNRALIARVHELEAKARRRDLMVENALQFAFYDQRLPADVYNSDLFEAWRKQAERAQPRVLYMAEADLLTPAAAEVTPERFPTNIKIGGSRLNIRYTLDPGTPRDGITLDVPLEALNQLDATRAEWLVPGRLPELVEELLRNLPKQYRHVLPSVPAFAAEILPKLRFADGSLLDQLADHLRRAAGVTVPREAWQWTELPPHLRMNFRVLDAQGKELALGRDLDELRRQLGVRAVTSFAAFAGGKYHRDGLKDWTFEALPESVRITRGQTEVLGYPALIDQERAVGLRLYDTPEQARREHHAGLRRLFMLKGDDELRRTGRGLPAVERLIVQHGPVGDAKMVVGDLLTLAADRAFLWDDADIRDPSAFELRLAQGRDRLWNAGIEVRDLVSGILAGHQAVQLRLAQPAAAILAPIHADVRDQMARLVYPRFLVKTPARWLAHMPRFVAAAEVRLSKLTGNAITRDLDVSAEFRPYWEVFTGSVAHAEKLTPAQREAFELYRWMLEEMRVQLYAQHLGTSLVVSLKRLGEQWAKVTA